MFDCRPSGQRSPISLYMRWREWIHCSDDIDRREWNGKKCAWCHVDRQRLLCHTRLYGFVCDSGLFIKVKNMSRTVTSTSIQRSPNEWHAISAQVNKFLRIRNAELASDEWDGPHRTHLLCHIFFLLLLLYVFYYCRTSLVHLVWC